MLIRRAILNSKTIFTKWIGLHKLDQCRFYSEKYDKKGVCSVSKKSNHAKKGVFSASKAMGFYGTIDLHNIPPENRLHLNLVEEEEEASLICRLLKTIRQMRQTTSAYGISWGGKPSTYHDPRHPLFTLEIKLTKELSIGLGWLKGNMYLLAFTEGMKVEDQIKDSIEPNETCSSVCAKLVSRDKKELPLIERATWFKPKRTELDIVQGGLQVDEAGMDISYDSIMSLHIGMSTLITALKNLALYKDPHSYHVVCVHFAELTRFAILYDEVSKFANDHEVFSLNDLKWHNLIHSWQQKTNQWINVCTAVPPPDAADKHRSRLQKELAVLLRVRLV